MGKVVLDLSMSLDGFIAGPKDDDKPDRELGGLDILHEMKTAHTHKHFVDHLASHMERD